MKTPSRAATSIRTPRARKGVRRSLENPKTPLSGPEAFDEDGGSLSVIGLGRSVTKVKVNRNTVMTYSAVWRATNLISQSVAKINLFVLRNVPPRGTERDRKHPGFLLLRRKPNEYMNSVTFKQVLTAHVLLHGNGYAWIKRDGAGRPVAMYPLDPERTWPVRINKVLSYVTEQDGEIIRMNADDVLHLKGLGYDGLVGYSFIQYGAESAGLGLAARHHSAQFFGKGARPGMVLEYPQTMNKAAKDNLLRSWDSMYSGPANAHKTALLENGVIAKTVGVNAKDSQLIESRQFEIREIANFTGLPPHKLGDNSKSSYNSLEQENQAYLDDCLDWYLVLWETEAADKLLSEDEKDNDTHTVQFERAALLRVDYKSQTDSLVQEVNNGLLLIDEARAIRNRPPYPDGIGSKPMRPVNIAPLEAATVADDPAPPLADESDTDGMSDDTGRAVRKVLSRIGEKALRASLAPDAYGATVTELTGELARLEIAAAAGEERAAKILEAVRQRLLAASECKPAHLRRRVERAAMWIVAELGF
jgi:HK97 family phage portal protein